MDRVKRIWYSSAQSRENLRCSLIQAVSQEEPSDRKPDPWPLWMAGHAQLKLVMTECSKTQIRLTGLIYGSIMFVHGTEPLHCRYLIKVHIKTAALLYRKKWTPLVIVLLILIVYIKTTQSTYVISSVIFGDIDCRYAGYDGIGVICVISRVGLFFIPLCRKISCLSPALPAVT